MNRREDLIEAIRVASFEHPKAGSHTEWATRIGAAIDVYDATTGWDLIMEAGKR